MKRDIARFISRISNPIFVIPIGIGLLFIKPELSAGLSLPGFIAFFIIEVLTPLSFFLYSLRVGKISNWEITKREERFRLYLFTVGCWFAGLILISTFGNDYLFSVLLILTLLAYLFAILTVITKISVHVGTSTALILLVNLFFGFRYFPLFLLVPVVAWSRIRLGYHTYWQVWAGILLPLILMPSGFKILGIG